MAAARFSSTISSTFLISRASSMICWPSTMVMPAFCSSNSIGVSTMSTPTGILSTLASRRIATISSAWCFIRPRLGGTVPRMPTRPALQCSGSSQGE